MGVRERWVEGYGDTDMGEVEKKRKKRQRAKEPRSKHFRFRFAVFWRFSLFWWVLRQNVSLGKMK